VSAALYCPLDGRRGCPPGGAEACAATYGRECFARLEADDDHGEAAALAAEYGTTAAVGAVLTLATWHEVHDDDTACVHCGRRLERRASGLRLPSGAGPYCGRRCAVDVLCRAAAAPGAGGAP